ncbi:MAG: NAD(P)/FAD-dependent oxidoreductase [Gemmatimonadaceae bacterium]|nr:NAD(P)/FAD-dependent oxidoreductase [Gemmatimonadaceae bacterium]
MTGQFDLVVLGSGTGGAAPAHACRAAGWSVAVIDDRPFGGTCENRGCDPKKVLVGAADVVYWAERMKGHGVAGDARIDWPSLMAFKREFTDPVPASMEEGFRKEGIETLHGEARFVAEDRIAIGDRELVAKHVVIATGASPRVLEIPGEEHVINSTEFLDLDVLPRRVAFIGAGYISLEFAHLARHAGAEVIVLGRGAPLPSFEVDLVARLIEHTRKIGIDVRLDKSVCAVERVSESGPYRVQVGHGANTEFVETDLVVHGAGRVPNSARIGAASGRVELEHHGAIRVNDFLQSVSNPRVYAAGDVVSPPGAMPLTPVAGHEGAVVAKNLLGGNVARPDLRAVPSVVFTLPVLARVGLTEAAARATGMQIRVETKDTTQWFTNRRVREPAGMFKTIIDEKTDRIVGAHLLGTEAAETINLFAMAIRFDISVTELKTMICAYPTGASNISYML